MFLNTIFNLLSKPFISYFFLSVVMGGFFSFVVALFLPNESYVPILKNDDVKIVKFNVAEAFGITQKVKKIKKAPTKATSHEYVLKDFTITGIFLSDDSKMVIVNDKKVNKFVYLNESYKGYKLVEVYMKKAKFKKGINFYWAFISADDEKLFRAKKSALPQTSSGGIAVDKTVAKKMFEDIKYKNGKYYIPGDMIGEYKNLGRIFSSIGIRAQRGKKAYNFKIVYVKPNSVFSKLGLKRGDVITKVNGEEFATPNGPMKLFQNIDNLKQVNLSIFRGSVKKELKYEVY